LAVLIATAQAMPPLPVSVLIVVAAFAASAFLALLASERVAPLRTPTQSKGRRLVIALAFALTGAAAMALAYPPVVFAAVEFAKRHRIGVLRWARVPPALAAPLSFVALDYSLWVWHRLAHRAPLLWRFHAAHHADLDLDTLTAWRFHFGELFASVFFRAATAVFLGVDTAPLVLWEMATLVFIQFHHSNVRLPERFERTLRLVLVTPRIHGIHHSTDAGDVSSNFGTIFSIWDRLHGLHRWRLEPVRPIGLAQLRDAGDVTLLRSLGLPISRIRLPPPEATR
jgi:sterol desaturase/sphingolipid hydroxylase (fatty acid hydroxylase superfamily)